MRQANDEKRHLLRWWVHTYDNPRPVRGCCVPLSLNLCDAVSDAVSDSRESYGIDPDPFVVPAAQIAPHFAPRSNVQEKGGFTVPKGSKLRLPLYPYSRHDGLGQSPASPVEAS